MHAIQLKSTEDILELMKGSIYAAAVGAAMELGLFWLLEKKPLPAQEIAQRLSIPLNRCHYWIKILCRFGLLEEIDGNFAPSQLAHEFILDVLDRDSWAFQAWEDRGIASIVRDLALNISNPMSAWQGTNLAPADELKLVKQDPTYISRFTRKLYQIHLSLAEQLAGMLDLQGVKRLLDLGGGSGVITFALLRKYTQLTAVVVDDDIVCQVGRKIAAENMLEGRIDYTSADFLKEDFPLGFDMAMLCDVGIYSQALFDKIYAYLPHNGRLVIVDKYASGESSVPESRLLSAFIDSLESNSQSTFYITVEFVQSILHEAKFRDIVITPVPHKGSLPWNLDWTLIEAKK